MAEKEKKIENLEDLPGVGAGTAEKLRDAGFKNIESIAVAAIGELVDAAGVGEGVAKKIITAARNSMDMGYETAAELMERRGNIGYITTGSKELDGLLGGKGVESRAITEAYGKFASGKTQIGLQLCINVQLPKEKGGMEANALFIDTEATFRPERIQQMAKHAKLDPDKALKNVFVARAFNSDHQMLLAEKAADLIEENNIKVLVVDSLTSLFRSEYVGRGTLASRQQKLNRHLHSLQKVADLNNLAVFVTNQVMANPALLFGDPTSPIGGNIVAHQSTYRLYLRKSKGDKRIARLTDSPWLPEGECIFRITPDGLKD
jgi:DNA repair protein RadA